MSPSNSYLFVSRPSSQSRYYKKILKRHPDLGEFFQLKTPRFASYHFLNQAKTIAADDLNKVYFLRKQSKNPALFKIKPVIWLWKKFKYALEIYRVAMFATAFARSKHNAIVIGNGQKQPNLSAVYGAQLAKKKIAFIEAGLLPDSTAIDFKGVNAANSLPRDKSFYLNWQPINSQMPAQQLTVREPLKGKVVHSNKEALPEKFIFVPFQVAVDTQVVANSNWITDMEKLYSVIQQLSETITPQYGVKFVIKEHPSCNKTYAHLHYQSDHIIFKNDANTQELITQSQAVITLNSSVGLEALLLEKKVIVLGDACYDIDDLVLNAKNMEQLVETTHQIHHWNYDDRLRKRFIMFIDQIYNVPGKMQKNLTEQHMDAVANRLRTGFIKGLDDINQLKR